jgi:hypothetical protein
MIWIRMSIKLIVARFAGASGAISRKSSEKPITVNLKNRQVQVWSSDCAVAEPRTSRHAAVRISVGRSGHR